MTEKVAKYISESDTESTFQSPEKMKENVDNSHITAGVSGESDEYGTASDDEESGDYSDEDDETNSEGPEDENEESVVLDAERQSGDGQEQDAETKKKVDDDEDRSNPQYIPKKGTFYEHDDRTAEDADAEVEEIPDDESCDLPPGGGSGSGKEKEKKDGRIAKKWQASQDRWTHDRFDEGEQAPKSRSELVSSYGYDIRNEDGPPRARRRRRYGRGPSKYTRNWEDESAYTKQTAAQQKKLRPEDFPALGTEQPNPRTKSRRRERQSSSEYKENNDRNIERNERHSRDSHQQSFKEYKTTSNRRSGQKTNERQPSDRNANRGNYRQPQPNTIEYVNRNKDAAPPRNDQRYENRQQSYEQEMNYNRVMYQQQQQQQQQQQHQQQQLEDERRYQKKSAERDNRVPVNQRLQNQEVMQNVVHMQQQQPPPMMRQEMIQQKPTVQMQQVPPPANVVMNDANRTKRYSIQRQRQGMEVPQQAQMVVQQQQGQLSVQEQQSQMEAALLQQLQNEKLKQIQSSMGHQKQISYHQAAAIANQNSPPNSQINLAAQPQQYPAYYAPPQNPDYGQANAQQQQQQQSATVQNTAAAAASQYPYAYIQPQQAPQSFPAPPQPAPPPQYQPQPAYRPLPDPYQTATAAYNPATAQPAQPAPAPIYQSQPPPNIQYYAATTHPAAPQTNPPQRVTRRPTNAIPILAPPDKIVPQMDKDPKSVAGPDTSENIDHIIDNMFTRRPPIQPVASAIMKAGPNDPNAIADAVKGLSLKEDNKDEMDKKQNTDQVG